MLLNLQENSSSRSDILLVFLPINGYRRQLGTGCAILVPWPLRPRIFFGDSAGNGTFFSEWFSRSGHYRSPKPSESELHNELPIILYIPGFSALFETAMRCLDMRNDI
jgi:hypothetical protein